MTELKEEENKEFFEFIRKASQIELFYMIRSLGDLRHVLDRAYHHNELEYQPYHDDTELAYLKQTAAAKELGRYGINTVKDGGPTQEFMDWYKRFDTFEKNLTPEEYQKLEARMNAREDTTDVVPK